MRRESRLLVSPELQLSRGRAALYYALDRVTLPYAGTVYASHFGVAYAWPVGGNFSVRGGVGPSYVTVERLGGVRVALTN